MDGHFESRKKRQMEMRDPVLNQLQGLVQTFQDTADRLTGTESNLEVLMRKQIADVMVRYVRFYFISIVIRTLHSQMNAADHFYTRLKDTCGARPR